MRRSSTALLILAALASSALALDLVRDGKPVATVVVGGSGAERFAVAIAAKDFVYHVKRITGAELPTMSAGDPGAGKVKNPVFIGPSRFTRALGIDPSKLPLEGCRLLVNGKVAAIVGKDIGKDPFRARSAPATWYGVAHYFEKHHGVRWFWPGEDGLYFEPATDLAAPALDETVKPAFILRKMRTSYSHLTGYFRGIVAAEKRGLYANLRGFDFSRKMDEMKVWERRMRLGRPVSLESGHTQWFRKRFWPDHPEYFALQMSGRRGFPPQAAAYKLCVANPELVPIVVEEAKRHFRRRPGSYTFNLGFSDGDGWCWCDACKGRDPRDQLTRTYPTYTKTEPKIIEYPYLTDRYVGFWNEVARELAKTHPDKYLAVFLYGAAKAPPVREKFHPSILVASTSPGSLSGPSFDVRRTDLEGWFTPGLRSFYWRPNLMVGNKGTPHMYPVRIGRLMKYFHFRGAKGFDFDGAATHFAMDGVNYYVVLRLAWDPTLDPEALVDEYCRKGFGRAGDAMRRYVGLCMKLHDKRLPGMAIPQVYDLEAIEILEAMAKEVEQASKGDAPQFRRRVRVFQDGHRYAMLASRARVVAASPYRKPPEAYYRKLVAVARRRYEVLNSLGGSWALNSAALLARIARPYGARILPGHFEYTRVSGSPFYGKLPEYMIVWGAGKKEVIAQRGRITVDGDASDWPDRLFSKPFRDNFSLRKARARTDMALAYDDAALYLCVRCEEPGKVYAYRRENDSSLVGKNDSLEVFFDTDLNPDTYYHFMADAIGGRYDARKDDAGLYTCEWNGPWTSRVAKTSKGWVAEMRFPFKTLGLRGVRPGDKWRFTVARTRRGARPQEYTAFSPLMGGFATPSHRANLYFQKKRPAPNLFPWGSFEAETAVAPGAGGPRAGVVRLPGPEGGKALRVVAPEASGRGMELSWAVPPVASRAYKLTLRHRGPRDGLYTAVTLGREGDAAPLAGDTHTFRRAAKTGDAWRTHTHYFMLPEDAATAALRVGFDKAGEYWIDDVRLTELD